MTCIFCMLAQLNILCKNWAKLMCHCQIQCNFRGIDLSKLSTSFWTHSLTHCCAWPAEVRSVLHIERSWPAIQAAPTDSGQNSKTFYTWRTFLSPVVAKLSYLKNTLAHPVLDANGDSIVEADNMETLPLSGHSVLHQSQQRCRTLPTVASSSRLPPATSPRSDFQPTNNDDNICSSI